MQSSSGLTDDAWRGAQGREAGDYRGSKGHQRGRGNPGFYSVAEASARPYPASSSAAHPGDLLTRTMRELATKSGPSRGAPSRMYSENDGNPVSARHYALVQSVIGGHRVAAPPSTDVPFPSSLSFGHSSESMLTPWLPNGAQAPIAPSGGKGGSRSGISMARGTVRLQTGPWEAPEASAAPRRTGPAIDNSLRHAKAGNGSSAALAAAGLPDIVTRLHQETGESVAVMMALHSQGLLSQIPRNDEGQITTLGSLRHGSGDCSPCVFWFQNACVKGMLCSYCHFRHAGQRTKRIRPSKRTRQRLRGEAANADQDPGDDFQRTPPGFCPLPLGA